MAEPLLEVRDLLKRFGGLVATDHVSLAVQPGEMHLFDLGFEDLEMKFEKDASLVI